VTKQTAEGEFDVRLTPVDAPGPGIGEMTIDKGFRGALVATSRGRMLAVRTPVDGSAGYVAMETVDGTLDGRRGTFALQHSGTMDKGAQSLSVAVVPDSGTGDLKGLSGTMAIRLDGPKHFYAMRYKLPD